MKNNRPIYTAYVPHGINHNKFYPIDKKSKDYDQYMKFKQEFEKNNPNDFIIFWNNRNIRRKQPGDLILSYRYFCDMLPKNKSSRVILFMHTQIRDENGTDLMEVKETLCRDYKVLFSVNKISTQQLNFYYNLADVTVNIASNEGFGLSGAESLMSGTVIINNVTGGLQDQCRFTYDDNNEWIDFDSVFTSNHTGVYRKHAPWAYPVFPSNRSLQGSVATPYIFDDRCSFEDVAIAMKYWYDKSRKERKKIGLEARSWMLSEESGMSAESMGNRFIKHINNLLKDWVPNKRYHLEKVKKVEGVNKFDGITWQK